MNNIFPTGRNVNTERCSDESSVCFKAETSMKRVTAVGRTRTVRPQEAGPRLLGPVLTLSCGHDRQLSGAARFSLALSEPLCATASASEFLPISRRVSPYPDCTEEFWQAACGATLQSSAAPRRTSGYFAGSKSPGLQVLSNHGSSGP